VSGLVATLADATAVLLKRKSRHTKFETIFIVPHFIVR
jgi:hypothetical protein